MNDKFRVWAEVDLGKLRSNYAVIRAFLPGATAIMGVVKASAYGHGAVEVGRCLAECGIDALGVGDSIEALELRDAGIDVPIYILGALAGEEISRIVELDIIPTVHSHEVVSLLENEAAAKNKLLQVNVIVDTGMGRLGVKPGEAMSILQHIDESPHLFLEGVSTHFPSSSSGDREFTALQIDQFNKLIATANESDILIPSKHAANSAAMFAFPDSVFNMVRPGIALYGINPGNLDVEALGLQPVLSLKTQVVFIKNVKAGNSIGYDRTYFTKEASKIATVPVGYNDGYHFALSNKASVLVAGERRPVVGTVSMDYTMLDLGIDSKVSVGDEVVLIGQVGAESITAVDLATIAGTIPYEIITSLGKRIKRIYV